jgi:2-polyprenyl-6-methoxyphenol hydroxylase-like FAD-dependent oxidoreductase
VIKKMGLMPQIRVANTKETGTRFLSSSGQPVAEFPVKEGSNVSMTSEYEILRGDLAKILWEATRYLPNITYHFGLTITSVLQKDDQGVIVLLSNGQTLSADVLVAADGQWSRLRSSIFPPSSINIKHQGMYGVYFTIPRLPSDKNYWDIHISLASRTISTRPDPHGTMRAMFTFMPSTPTQEAAWETASRAGRKEQEALLKATFGDAGWQTQRLLDTVSTAPDFYFHAISQIRMSSWACNRVVCLGDAAYCPTPLTGMGTSLAIVGAYMLAGELSKTDGSSLTAALSAYETAFRPFVTQTQEIPPFVPGIMHPGSSFKRFLLQTLLKVVAWVVAIPWVANRTGDAESRDDGFRLPIYPGLAEKKG